MSIIHRIVHALGLSYDGDVIIRTKHGRLIVAFKCNTCGKIEGVHDATRVVNAAIANAARDGARP